jgi:hypothetical protein
LFGFFLAEKHGRIDVDRMLEEMTSRQLTEWRAYYSVINENGGMSSKGDNTAAAKAALKGLEPAGLRG